MGTHEHLFARVLAQIHAALRSMMADGALPSGLDLGRVTVEPPREESHGDMSTNAAMVLAKAAGQKPRALADAVAERLRQTDLIASVDVAGPGFINLVLRPDAWGSELTYILTRGRDYGRSSLGQGAKVNVEYVSANPTGPLTVAHGRGAVFGDALANLLAFSGFAVTREYYVNDAGGQVDILAKSAFLRYREALGDEIGEIPAGLYPGDYLRAVGRSLADRFGASLRNKPPSEWLPLIRAETVEAMMSAIRVDLAAININHDVIFSERSLLDGGEDRVANMIDVLKRAGHVYVGRLPPPKGAPSEDWEDREQELFRATEFGDDVDRPLRKSNGDYTYFATDIAYHKSKFDRGFRTMIDVWGADHAGYIKRLQAAVRAVTGAEVDLDVKIVQIVRLLRRGEIVKMSKRAGEFVTLREVVDEVGRDAVRFMMLHRKNDAVLDFDLTKVIEQTRDNPVFYVQYAHARAQSVLRNAAELFPDIRERPQHFRETLAGRDTSSLAESGEIGLMRRLSQYPRMLEAAAAMHEPHRIAFYLSDLAGDFHAQWNRGKDTPHLRFIIPDDPERTMMRLGLVQGIADVLGSGLELLGVGAPHEMR